MALNYTGNLPDLDSVFDGLLDSIVNNLSGVTWELVYTNPDGTNLALSTTDGTENTTNMVYVTRGKLETNTEGTSDNEYSYIILEKDAAFNRVIVRTCQSFTTGGVSSNVTAYSDVTTADLFLDTVGADNGVAFNGVDHNVTISVRSVGGVSSVTLSQLRNYPVTFDQNNAYALLKAESTKAYVVENTGFTGSVLNRASPDSLIDSISSPLEYDVYGTLSGVVGFSIALSNESDELVGYLDKVLKSSSSTPSNYDILKINNTPAYIVFSDGSGHIATEL